MQARIPLDRGPLRKLRRKQSDREQQEVEPGQGHPQPAVLQRAIEDPSTLTPETTVALQRQYGNQYVQRLIQKHNPAADLARSDATVIQRDDDPLPDITGLSDTAQALLDGVMAQTTIDAAVHKIHQNMHTKTGWSYNASVRNISGRDYVDGGTKVGMCESYRQAFGYILTQYDNLRAAHPLAAIKDGRMDIELGNDLNAARFYTRTGLTLMGPTALKGNVYLEADGTGQVINQGEAAINRFVFQGHWTLKVNGKEYDPIFPGSIDQNNVEAILDNKYSDGAMRLLADTSRVVPTGEFGATFVLVRNYAEFDRIKKEIGTFATDNQTDVDFMLTSNFLQRWRKGIFKKKNADIVQRAKTLMTRDIVDQATFKKMIEVGYMTGATTREEMKAFEKIAKLASY